ncbi:integral membrane sensor signal transduction histidine kinase [Desulfobulbus propionicus DSM 2032]|uniref:histidine kinase n=1 Tax=Desulfobulbus propionicus (strain ATCC 33891 / DSM 2032 / VKM B-1956 / 1pr3) TaxID=577650 RepID=A0A7U3YL40_DESPD|nr:HAMP domain-containing sensor histidine kinase [Desulfobulbus propionicus]ADW17370.1 integral membrane sensor signal transduction histidine kinase [Desulfobulbus propionicus DSM 2032]
MKIRNRITLWVSLAGLVSSVVLSLIVFFWGLETPYEFLDQELEIRAHTLVDELAREQASGARIGGEALEHFSHLYWARLYDADGRLLFASRMAREIDLPLHSGRKGYLTRTDIPLNRFYSDEEDEPAAFWNRVFTVPTDGVMYRVHVARPVESLVGESIESAVMIGSALLASALILIVVSYQVAGRILQPVQEINRLSAEITENTLEKRIPLAGNRDEIDELAASLNAMFNRLQYSFLRQKEFVANASHELKTPLTLLRLSMEEMLQDGQLPVPMQERLLTQERTLTRISQLVKSLLDLSRLEMSESLERTTFSLNALIAAVVDEFQPLLQERRLRFTSRLDGELRVHADQEKMRRMLINLFDNAIRYNQPEGEIRCQTRTEGGQVVLVVANTGPGIGVADQQRVFDQFFRCEQSRSTTHGGSGLGLTIVKRIVELHGGSIAVESTASAWTAFTVTLPFGSPG